MHDNISALRVNLYDCAERPSLIVERERPRNALRSAWIPQTIGDQIWVMYEFETEAARLDWEGGLSEQMRKWLDRGVIPHGLPYGWATHAP